MLNLHLGVICKCLRLMEEKKKTDGIGSDIHTRNKQESLASYLKNLSEK